MNSLDLLVLLTLGGMAAWPFIASPLLSMIRPRPATPAAPAAEGGSIVEEWRQAWAFTLMRLIDDIETGGSHFEDKVLARKLTRDLLWEVIGGDGPVPSKGK